MTMHNQILKESKLRSSDSIVCMFSFFPCEKQQVCVWADGRELADAPWG